MQVTIYKPISLITHCFENTGLEQGVAKNKLVIQLTVVFINPTLQRGKLRPREVWLAPDLTPEKRWQSLRFQPSVFDC